MTCIKRTHFLTLFIFLLSCDRPECKNTNNIFDRFEPHSKEYREELAKQLQERDANDLIYWFDQYEFNNDREYIIIHIQGKELCAKGVVFVEDWKELKEIKKTKGMGYRGAQLKGFEMGMRKNLSGTEFIFNDVDYIID